MILSKSLPTKIAKVLAIGVDLYIPDNDNHNTVEDWEDKRDRLITFQQLAISGKIEDAMLAYHGLKLSEEQLSVLQTIFLTTQPWLMGHVVGRILEKLDGGLVSGRDATELATMLVDKINTDKSIDKKTKRSLIVRFADVGVSE